MASKRMILEFDEHTYATLAEYVDRIVEHSTFPSTAKTRSKQRSMVIEALLTKAWKNHTRFAFKSVTQVFQAPSDEPAVSRGVCEEGRRTRTQN